jgi:hypothetical protein
MASTHSRLIDDLETLLPSWQRHLRAANLSPRTITAYLSTGQTLVPFLRAVGMPTAASGIRREHLETFIEAQLARFRPSTAATRCRDSSSCFAGHLMWARSIATPWSGCDHRSSKSAPCRSSPTTPSASS